MNTQNKLYYFHSQSISYILAAHMLGCYHLCSDDWHHATTQQIYMSAFCKRILMEECSSWWWTILVYAGIVFEYVSSEKEN